MPLLAFTKVEGLGNDFVLLDRRADTVAEIERLLPRLTAAAPRICDRRRGVGADGILIVGPGRTADGNASMWVVNHDGSQPEMCGNGLRCVALVATGAGSHTITIDTDAGPKRCSVEAPNGEGGDVEVDMGPSADLGSHSPASAEGRTLHGVSMGNPHAVSFVGTGEDPEALARRLGPGVERDREHYPEGTNVEFCQAVEGRLVLWVWERGCGITEACGTGACATAVAAAAQGLVPTEVPVTVQLPGGALQIQVPSTPHDGVIMRGPARVVFAGTIVA